MHSSTIDITNLDAFFGATPGADQVLIDWDPMCSWIDAIAHSSANLCSQILGHSTDGRELRMVIASSPESITNLDTIIAQRATLATTQLYRDMSNNSGSLAGSKPVVLVTAGIHATEVGGVQLMPQLILDLAHDPQWQEILESIIVLVVPTLNPDGMEMVHHWYNRTLGTPAEGTSPPALYHQFAGHDNNRDWYQHHLQETQVIVDEVHRIWRPHVVIDLHQMGQNAPRYVVPPYVDPTDSRVHPLLYQLAGELGTQIATDHVRAGNGGVCHGVMFDCYSPTRAFQHYHGGVRILAEAASAGIASPVKIDSSELLKELGVKGIYPGGQMPISFEGDSWHLTDIMRLHRQTIDTVLTSVANNASRWIQDQWRVLSDQVNGSDRGCYVIPALKQQIDPAAAIELIDILRRGDLEVYVAESNSSVAQAGAFVVPVQQPFGSYARTLLDLLIYPTGNQPYDVTSHCLPIHMGVEVAYRSDAPSESIREINELDLKPFAAATAEQIQPNAWLAIDPRSSASIRLVNNALKTGSQLRRTTKPHLCQNRLIPAGAWIVTDGTVWDIMAHAAEMNIRTWIIDQRLTNAIEIVLPRIGVYDPQHVSASDFGWLTLWLQRSGFDFTVITGEGILHGQLNSIDTLLFPHAAVDVYRAKSRSMYPAEFARGLSDRVNETLRTWIQRGGHVIAFEDAVQALSEPLEIDLNMPLTKLNKRSFASSGAAVRVEPIPGLDLTLGIEETYAGMHIGTSGFHIPASGSQVSAAKFASTDTVVSGTIHGSDHLAGLHAIVQTKMSHGHVTAFAFRPHFRTQMLASETALTNAIMQQFGPEGISL